MAFRWFLWFFLPYAVLPCLLGIKQIITGGTQRGFPDFELAIVSSTSHLIPSLGWTVITSIWKNSTFLSLRFLVWSHHYYYHEYLAFCLRQASTPFPLRKLRSSKMRAFTILVVESTLPTALKRLSVHTWIITYLLGKDGMTFQLHTWGQPQGFSSPCPLGYYSLLRFSDVHQCFSGGTRDSKTGSPATSLQPVIATCQPLNSRLKSRPGLHVITQHKAEQSCTLTHAPVQSVPSPHHAQNSILLLLP